MVESIILLVGLLAGAAIGASVVWVAFRRSLSALGERNTALAQRLDAAEDAARSLAALRAAVKLWSNCRDYNMGRATGRQTVDWMDAADNLQHVYGRQSLALDR